MPVWTPEQIAASTRPQQQDKPAIAPLPGLGDEGGAGVLADMATAVKEDVWKTLQSIPYLPEAVITFGQDDGAPEERKELRRRALALTVSTLLSMGLGGLAASVARGVGVPLLARLAGMAGSIPGRAVEAGVGNVAFGQLDRGPGEEGSPMADFLVGAGFGGLFGMFSKARQIARMDAVRREEARVLAENTAKEAIEGAAGVGEAGGAKPALPASRKTAMRVFYAEINEHHPDLAGELGREGKRGFATEVLGRPIASIAEITEAEELRKLTNALRARRGEGPISARLPNVVVRLGPKNSASFPDEIHRKLYQMGETGKISAADAHTISGALGVAPESVGEAAATYTNLTRLAAQAEGGVLVKMPSYPEALEMMPRWISEAGRRVAGRVSSPAPRMAKTAGDRVVSRGVAQNQAAEQSHPSGVNKVEPAKPAVVSVQIGRRVVEMTRPSRGKIGITYAGKTLVVDQEAFFNRIKEAKAAGKRVVLTLENGKKVVFKGGGPSGRGRQLQKALAAREEASIVGSMGKEARAKALGKMRTEVKASLGKHKGFERVPTPFMESMAKAMEQGDVSIAMRAADEFAFRHPKLGSQLLQTTEEALKKRGAGDLAAEYVKRKAFQEDLYRLIHKYVKLRSSGPSGVRQVKGPKGHVPSLVEEYFGTSKVVGAKPRITSKTRAPKSTVTNVGDRAKLAALARRNAQLYTKKRILKAVGERMDTTRKKPGDRALYARLKAEIEALEGPGKPTQEVLPARAQAVKADVEARRRLAAEGEGDRYREIKAEIAEPHERPPEATQVVSASGRVVGRTDQLAGEASAAVVTTDGKVIVDTKRAADQSTVLLDLVKAVGGEANVQRIGFVKDGVFYGRKLRTGEKAPTVKPPAAEVEETPAPPKFGKGSRGPREKQPNEPPTKPATSARYNYLIERANHPDPNISETAKVHLKAEFGAEIPRGSK